MTPFFSIIIPTRNRSTTLYFTIQSILFQEFDNYEIIVSDNSDLDNLGTYHVIEQISSKKIKYIRTRNVLSMSENWEHGLKQARGDFFIFIGDDDALMPNSLITLHQLIVNSNFEVIRWEWVWYNWPNTKHEYLKNITVIPTGRKNLIRFGNEIVRNVATFNQGYMQLPMLYNSVISKVIIDKILKLNGHFFNSMTPDIFSGFVIAMTVDNYLSVGYPFSVNGGSEKSNGQNSSISESDISKEFSELGRESPIGFHKDFPFIPRSFPLAILEPYHQAKDLLRYPSEPIDIKNAYISILTGTTVHNKADYDNLLLEFHKILKGRKDLEKWFDEFVSSYEPSFKVNKETTRIDLGIKEDEIIIDAGQFDIADVYNLSIFVFKIIGSFNVDLFISSLPTIWHTSSKKKQRLSLSLRLRKALKVIIKGYYL